MFKKAISFCLVFFMVVPLLIDNIVFSSEAANYDAENSSITILGANLVYVGESFKYSTDYYSNDDDLIIWEVIGDSGAIYQDGTFTALKKGNVTLKAKSVNYNYKGSLVIHCIESADDVDFVPMVNGIPIANKTYPLPKNYDPGMRKEALIAFKNLQSDAEVEGITITMISGYRSYSRQEELFNMWKSYYGNEALRFSALPGYSEHQLGLAIDVNSCDDSFADTPEAKWIAEHCTEYGFILRYPSVEAEKITGYQYEPWHIRYLGKELAEKVTKSGLTLEEYLGIDSKYRVTTRPSFKISVSSLSFSEIKPCMYDGSASCPAIIVKNDGSILKSGKDYNVEYLNNTDIGTAIAVIKGNGRYVGTKVITFYIVPNKISLNVEKKSNNKVRLLWEQAEGVDGYIIYCSVNGDTYKKLNEVSAKRAACNISDLDIEKNVYRFKIRAYKKRGGYIYYGSYSKAVKVTANNQKRDNRII